MTTDQALLAQLRSTFEAVDPVPSDAVDIASATLSWRDPDAALAELVTDSLMDTALVRAQRAGGPRLLTFEANDLTVEVEVADDGETRRLLGQLVPPSRAEVVVRWANGQTRVDADEIGHFRASGIPSGQVSLSCILAHRTKPVTTSWVTI